MYTLCRVKAVLDCLEFVNEMSGAVFGYMHNVLTKSPDVIFIDLPCLSRNGLKGAWFAMD